MIAGLATRLAPPPGPVWTRPIVNAAFLADPYPTYRELREAGPIHWSEEFFGGAWLLTRHADVEAALRHSAFSARRTGGWVMTSDAARAELKPFQRMFARAMLFVDAPDHPRLRQVLNVGFQQQALNRLRPRVESMVAECLDRVDAGRDFDFLQAVARPLPANVIAGMLGIGPTDRTDFMAWADDLAAFIGAPQPNLELARSAQTSLLAMARCFETLLPRKRRCPEDDLVSRLVQAEAAGQIRDGFESLAQCAMLLFAGYETTRHLLGNGLHVLLSHPAQWDRLRREPQLMSSAVRELLRFESPVQYTGRRVAADTVVHGRLLARGDLVLPLIGAASRDPARFDWPDTLDVARRQGSSLSFGCGPHACIGAALAVMEAEIVFGHVLQRWPALRLADSAPRWSGNAVYRGLSSLRVRVVA